MNVPGTGNIVNKDMEFIKPHGMHGKSRSNSVRTRKQTEKMVHDSER